MADGERGGAGRVPGLVQDMIEQLRGITEGLEGLARFGSRSIQSPPLLPGSLSAAQLSTVSDAIAAQRQSIQALQAQLSSFDKQLAVLEQIVRPLTDWSTRWADLESKLLSLGRAQRASEQPPGEQPPEEQLARPRGAPDRTGAGTGRSTARGKT